MSYVTAHYITRRARLGPIDAQIVYPILIWALHIRGWTTMLLFFSIGFMWYLTSKGVDLMMLGRIVRRWLIGNHREIRSPWRKDIPL